MPPRWSQLQPRGGQDVPSALQLGPSRSTTSCLCLNACTPTSVHVGSTLSLMWSYKRKSEANVYGKYCAHKGPQIPAHKQLLIITAFCRCTPCCFHKYRRTIHHGEWKETLRGLGFPQTLCCWVYGSEIEVIWSSWFMILQKWGNLLCM